MPIKNTNKIVEKDVSSDNVISLYLKEINKIPMLSRADEDKYGRLAANGDHQAKQMLVQSNLRFVVNVAKKYRNQGLSLDDLISEGNIGLMNAADRFDPNMGYHFISYAVWWIRQAILKAICEKSRMIRLPLNRANELVQIEKARKTLQGPFSEREEIEEIAKLVHMNESHVSDLMNIAREHASLDTPVYNDRDSSSLGEFLEDTQSAKPEDYAITNELKFEVREALGDLSAKEAEILSFRFGLGGEAPMSLKEIGDRYKLTKERIRQIEKKAIRRLQTSKRSEYLQAYIAS